MSTSRILFALIGCVVVLGGCSRKRVTSTPQPSSEISPDLEAARRDSIARADAERRNADDRARAEASARAAEREHAEAEALRNVLSTPIYFEFDRSDLDADTRTALEAKREVLQRYASVQLRIEGHADERGSAEYNVALGQRRAAAAKRYLTQRGIGGDRLETVSLGEERPACLESTESCHARNRRAEFVMTAGALASTRP